MLRKLFGNEKTTKELSLDLIYVILGNFILAVSSTYFVLPFNILTGGVAGVAVVVTELTNIDSILVINVLTVVLFILGAFMLGKEFAYKTMLSAIIYPLCMYILSFFPIALDIDILLASIYTGVLIGLGVGIVFRTGASTGGMDIPPLIVNKYTNIKLSPLLLITDGLTVLLGLIAFGLEKSLIGLISVYIFSMVVDKVMMLGGAESKAIYIVSEHYEEINTKIQVQLDRGTTILSGKGGYTEKDRPVIFVVISQKEYPKLNSLVHHIDPQAFIVVSDATEVKGEGFSYRSPV